MRISVVLAVLLALSGCGYQFKPCPPGLPPGICTTQGG